MKPKQPGVRSDHDLFRMELANIIDSRHELVRLAELIDWPGLAIVLTGVPVYWFWHRGAAAGPSASG